MRPAHVQPIVLAGGLGTRLRPRTSYLPKPLLPVNGRPLLWYALNSIGRTERQPIVVTDYKREAIEAYFAGENITFRSFPGASMAECVLRLAEEVNCEALLCMSSDVLVPPEAIRSIIVSYAESRLSSLALTVLDQAGHKSWRYSVDGGLLKDITKGAAPNRVERAGLILRRDDLIATRQVLGASIGEYPQGHEFYGLQSGWILILKAAISIGLKIDVLEVDEPVLNVNDESDLAIAERFLANYYRDR
jgi:NDP-sugar pyrophosphorylase family protein